MFRKRIVSILLALATLVLVLPAATVCGHAEETVVLKAQNAEGINGQELTVYLSFENNSGIEGFQFRLNYDEAMLEAKSAVITIEGSDYKIVNLEKGSIEFMWASTQAYTADGVFASVTFLTRAMGETKVTPVFDETRGDCVYYADREDPFTFIDLPVSAVEATVSVLHDSEGDFYYALESSETPVNQKAQVELKMYNPSSAIYGFSIEIVFDPDKLAFDAGTFERLFPYGRFSVIDRNRVRVFAATDNKTPIIESAKMADLYFDVIDPDKAPGSTYDLTFCFYNPEPAYSLDQNRNVVRITQVGRANGKIVLGEAVNNYDLNNDGKVNISDVTALLDYLSGNMSAIAANANADFNGDKNINISDVTVLLDYLSGK